MLASGSATDLGAALKRLDPKLTTGLLLVAGLERPFGELELGQEPGRDDLFDCDQMLLRSLHQSLQDPCLLSSSGRTLAVWLF